MKIVLFNPLIPQNTGNIIRTCDVTGSSLILVEPIGFSISSRMLKRASLDYFVDQIKIIDDLDEFLKIENFNFYFFSSKAKKIYSDIKYKQNDILIFGSEKNGLPEKYLKKYPNRFLTIPMKKNKRCLNLSNTVSIVLYEAYRQQNFLFNSI